MTNLQISIVAHHNSAAKGQAVTVRVTDEQGNHRDVDGFLTFRDSGKRLSVYRGAVRKAFPNADEALVEEIVHACRAAF